MAALNLYKKPKLRDPYLVAAWPGFGNVAIGTASYLKDELAAEPFAEIEPHLFFSPTEVFIKNNTIETPEFPQSIFYYRQNDTANDLILFIGEAQPIGKTYEFANLVLEVAEQFSVKRIYTCAAHLASIHHSQEPTVWGTANDPELIQYLRGFEIPLMEGGTIAGMNGLLLGVAKERKLKGVCLFGEIPAYTVNMETPRASKAVLQVLTTMLGVQIDMTGIELLAERAEEEMEKEVARLAERAEGDEEANEMYELINSLKSAAISPIESEIKVIEDEVGARFRIEKLFEQAKREKSKAYELKMELDKLGMFKDYEDRFLALFRQGDRGFGQ